MLSLNDLLNIFYTNKLLEKYHLTNIGIFGSILHSNQPGDIDLLISDYSDHKDLFKLKQELETITGKSVDIVIEKHASPIIIHRAKKDIQYVA